MKLIRAAVLACLLAACSDRHVFEVDSGQDVPSRASLTLYGATSGMAQVGPRLIGSRRGGEGSGRITLVYDDGRTIDCPIGYVAARDPEPHRFAVRDGICEPND